mmetsp:Transcript_80554/g.249953  ORF Transcript_80554/g.249953 Transcript_80554/m.249953 type:complete len:268 (-) Transcript_80554:458-1261(-)
MRRSPATTVQGARGGWRGSYLELRCANQPLRTRLQGHQTPHSTSACNVGCSDHGGPREAKGDGGGHGRPQAATEATDPSPRRLGSQRAVARVTRVGTLHPAFCKVEACLNGLRSMVRSWSALKVSSARAQRCNCWKTKPTQQSKAMSSMTWQQQFVFFSYLMTSATFLFMASRSFSASCTSVPRASAFNRWRSAVVPISRARGSSRPSTPPSSLTCLSISASRFFMISSASCSSVVSNRRESSPLRAASRRPKSEGWAVSLEDALPC